MFRKKNKVNEEVEEQTTFNDDDMSILYDDEGNVVEDEGTDLSGEVIMNDENEEEEE